MLLLTFIHRTHLKQVTRDISNAYLGTHTLHCLFILLFISYLQLYLSMHCTMYIPYSATVYKIIRKHAALLMYPERIFTHWKIIVIFREQTKPFVFVLLKNLQFC